jgi:biotin transport system substrate-specific component
MIKKSKILYTTLCAMFAALFAVSAWISIPAVVPFTLQTFAMFLAADLLKLKSLISALCYIALGAVGLPVFAGFKGGFSALSSPTGGYIIGFIPMILIAGLAAKYIKNIYLKTVVYFIAQAVCYFFGTVYYMMLFADGTGVKEIAAACVLPFIIPDAIKIILAVLAGKTIDKKTSL